MAASLLKNIFNAVLVTVASGLMTTAAASAKTPLTDTLKLNDMMQDFASVAPGRDLIAYARAKNVRITYEDSLSDLGYTASYDYPSNSVALRKDAPETDKLFSLAFSLWCARQKNTLHTNSMREKFLDPVQQWALTMTQAADAFAFASYYTAAHSLKQDAPDTLSASHKSFNKIVAETRRKLRAGPMTPADYRETCLLPAFAQLQHLNVWLAEEQTLHKKMEKLSSQLSVFRQNGIQGVEDGDSIVEDYAKKLATEVSPGVFADYLRQFGGTDIDGHKPTALTEADSKQLMMTYPLKAEEQSDARIKAAHDMLQQLEGEDDNNRKNMKLLIRLKRNNGPVKGA